MAEPVSFIRRRLPLGGLRAFEAAARLGSFQLAAAELAVTATAISHQIRNLEARLGLKLFERQVRKVTLTNAGRRLFPVLREGFDSIAGALARISGAERASVTISAPVAFTARCLLPGLVDLRQDHPDIELRLAASDDPVDLRHGAADIAIRYASTAPYGLLAEPLLIDSYAPVCSPQLGVTALSDLSRQTLIHAEWRNPAPDTPSWSRWAAAAGLTGLERAPSLHFTDETHAIQAAVAGMGVALASTILVRDELAKGLLVIPFGPQLPGRPYQLLRPAPSTIGEASQDVETVCAWLRKWLTCN